MEDVCLVEDVYESINILSFVSEWMVYVYTMVYTAILVIHGMKLVGCMLRLPRLSSITYSDISQTLEEGTKTTTIVGGLGNDEIGKICMNLILNPHTLVFKLHLQAKGDVASTLASFVTIFFSLVGSIVLMIGLDIGSLDFTIDFTKPLGDMIVWIDEKLVWWSADTRSYLIHIFDGWIANTYPHLLDQQPLLD